MKKVPPIFLLSFILNLIWENLHSVLYAGYQGGVITEPILFRAAIIDALIITLLCLPFILFPKQKRKSWLIIPLAVIISIFIERWALQTGRWTYNKFMPIIPVLGAGLSPTIQLALIGYLTYWLILGKKSGGT